MSDKGSGVLFDALLDYNPQHSRLTPDVCLCVPLAGCRWQQRLRNAPLIPVLYLTAKKHEEMIHMVTCCNEGDELIVIMKIWFLTEKIFSFWKECHTESKQKMICWADLLLSWMEVIVFACCCLCSGGVVAKTIPSEMTPACERAVASSPRFTPSIITTSTLLVCHHRRKKKKQTWRKGTCCWAIFSFQTASTAISVL